MAKKKQAAKILVNGIDLTPVFRDASVPIDQGLRTHFARTRKTLNRLGRVLKAIEDAMKGLEESDRLGNFEIQTLMSEYNQAGALASSIAKKANDTINCIIRKTG